MLYTDNNRILLRHKIRTQRVPFTATGMGLDTHRLCEIRATVKGKHHRVPPSLESHKVANETSTEKKLMESKTGC